MQDNKPYLLSTQLLNQDLIDEAAEKGIALDCFSFVQIKPVIDPDLQEIIDELAGSQRVVAFTSQHAVQTVMSHLKGKKPGWSIFCTGPATRKWVADYFGEEHIAGTAHSAEALANIIIELANVLDIVFFCGKQHREELPEKLSAQGILVKEVVVYETELTPWKKTKNYDGILFFSPGAVHSYFSSNTVRTETFLFAIGKTTRDTITEYSSNPVILSQKPEKEILIRQAIDYFQKNTIHRLPNPAG